MKVNLCYATKARDECLERLVHRKNVFDNLPTQKRAYVIPVSGSQSTIVIWQQVWKKSQSLIWSGDQPPIAIGGWSPDYL